MCSEHGFALPAWRPLRGPASNCCNTWRRQRPRGCSLTPPPTILGTGTCGCRRVSFLMSRRGLRPPEEGWPPPTRWGSLRWISAFVQVSWCAIRMVMYCCSGAAKSDFWVSRVHRLGVGRHPALWPSATDTGILRLVRCGAIKGGRKCLSPAIMTSIRFIREHLSQHRQVQWQAIWYVGDPVVSPLEVPHVALK